jgi:hypothetical protein
MLRLRTHQPTTCIAKQFWPLEIFSRFKTKLLPT